MDGSVLPIIPKHVLQPGVNRDQLRPEEIVGQWLSKLSASIVGGSFQSLTDLFLEDCWWRDFISMNWDFTSKHGIKDVRTYLATATNTLAHIEPVQSGGLKAVLLDLAGMIWIQGAFTFANQYGSGRGMVKLLNTGETEWKAWIVFTQLEKLNFQHDLEKQKALNPAMAARKPAASTNGDGNQHEEHDLQVLVIGAGQAGLSLGARLRSMGIRTLLVDKNARFGDSWRARYKTVTLNTPTYSDHPPFMKLPENWPRWLPRDKVADFWEHYGQMMGVDCLFKTTVTNVKYDDSEKRYSVYLQQGGQATALEPRHVVLATGVFSGEPVLPHFPGQDKFAGQMYHSSKHVAADEIPDINTKRVVIVGAGTSAHDIAQDFVNSGANSVSIIQRSPIFYLSSKASETVQLALWNMEGISTEEADLAGNAIPLAVIRTMSIGMSHTMTEIDNIMIEGLQKAGLALRTGQDGYGLADYQLIKGGHFYLDQGASAMIVDGRIKVYHCEGGISDVEPHAVKLADGTRLDADIIVLATGYHNSMRTVEQLMGHDVATKMSPHFGMLDAENERAGVSFLLIDAQTRTVQDLADL
ncbi:putative flavin-binding monooxygenase protein [Paramyrothecium foliicola]|nr:putative flavin-binding monooxygenase protein [Paramyrothecium foliicola]